MKLLLLLLSCVCAGAGFHPAWVANAHADAAPAPGVTYGDVSVTRVSGSGAYATNWLTTRGNDFVNAYFGDFLNSYTSGGGSTLVEFRFSLTPTNGASVSNMFVSLTGQDCAETGLTDCNLEIWSEDFETGDLVGSYNPNPFGCDPNDNGQEVPVTANVEFISPTKVFVTFTMEMINTGSLNYYDIHFWTLDPD